jgi:DNA-binding response OmpR family regulator
MMPSRAGRKVILVVDDEPMVRDLIRLLLEAEGYLVLCAADGEEALLLSRAFPHTIHLVLSDVKIPKMDALQLRDRLLEERPGAKVLLMSGVGSAVMGHALLRKPFGPDALKGRVREMLEGKWAAARQTA